MSPVEKRNVVVKMFRQLFTRKSPFNFQAVQIATKDPMKDRSEKEEN